jgi:hypothetical protein
MPAASVGVARVPHLARIAPIAFRDGRPVRDLALVARAVPLPERKQRGGYRPLIG